MRSAKGSDYRQPLVSGPTQPSLARKRRIEVLTVPPFAMPSLDLELHVSPDEMLDYYRGAARTVHAVAANGQTVNFPASALQRHITTEGIHGWFRLNFDEHHKFVRLERTDPSTGLDRMA